VFTISKQDWDLYTSESTYDGYLYVYDGSSEEQAQSSDRYYTDSKYVFGEKGTIINNDGYEILNPTANAINKNLYNIIVNLQDKNDSPKVETNKIIASNSNYKDDLIRKSDIKIYVSKAFDLYE